MLRKSLHMITDISYSKASCILSETSLSLCMYAYKDKKYLLTYCIYNVSVLFKHIYYWHVMNQWEFYFNQMYPCALIIHDLVAFLSINWPLKINKNKTFWIFNKWKEHLTQSISKSWFIGYIYAAIYFCISRDRTFTDWNIINSIMNNNNLQINQDN